MIFFVGHSVLISLYSVEFLQFLQAIILHWIHSKFYLCLFVCVQSASYLMYYIAVFATIFLRLIFHSFKPYSYPIIFTLKIYQSVVLKVVQLFPVPNLFPSSVWLRSVSDFGHPAGPKNSLKNQGI